MIVTAAGGGRYGGNGTEIECRRLVLESCVCLVDGDNNTSYILLCTTWRTNDLCCLLAASCFTHLPVQSTLHTTTPLAMCHVTYHAQATTPSIAILFSELIVMHLLVVLAFLSVSMSRLG